MEKERKQLKRFKLFIYFLLLDESKGWAKNIVISDENKKKHANKYSYNYQFAEKIH